LDLLPFLGIELMLGRVGVAQAAASQVAMVMNASAESLSGVGQRVTQNDGVRPFEPERRKATTRDQKAAARARRIDTLLSSTE
jgi:hypothetical protein